MKKITLAALALLAGCANQPQSLILAPLEPHSAASAAQPRSIALSSLDLRSETYLARIERDGEAATLLSASTNPRQLFEQGLADGLTQMGYRIGSDGEIRMELNLETLRMDVQQDLFAHNANSTLVARLNITQGQRELVKRYQARGEFSGLLQADAARLEREINDRLQQLLNAILDDPELHRFIQ
ncbi:YajG family lipoprotein [Ferrimonas pelagia]|uniref:Lipoprotein n=1 Tax=Ferrimonas pelagia TaxID=1177826 RepID=A0ABP9EIZ7_9GAMM